MTTILIIIHIIVCFFLIAIVLLQHGKGADIGATFGGSSQTLFGTEGPVPLLNKITTIAAIVFMCTSVALAYISAHKSTGSVMSEIKTEAPAVQEPVKREAASIPLPEQTEQGQPVAEKTEQPTQETK